MEQKKGARKAEYGEGAVAGSKEIQELLHWPGGDQYNGGHREERKA